MEEEKTELGPLKNTKVEQLESGFAQTFSQAAKFIFEDRERAVEVFEEIRSRWTGGDSAPSVIRELNIALGLSQEPTKQLIELANVVARLKASESKIQINTQETTIASTDNTNYENIIDIVDDMIKKQTGKEEKIKIIQEELNKDETESDTGG